MKKKTISKINYTANQVTFKLIYKGDLYVHMQILLTAYKKSKNLEEE